MNDLLIINAGGYGKTVASLAESDPGFNKLWRIAGMLDNRNNISQTSQNIPVIGDPERFNPLKNQVFVCALGDSVFRRRYATMLLDKGARFISLIPNTIMAYGVSIGPGSILDHHTVIGSDSHLASFSIMHAFSVIGHDVVVGEFSSIGSFVFVGGNVTIGDDVMIFPHASILPSVKIGNGARVGAGSVVVKDVPDNATVFGNPAKIIY